MSNIFSDRINDVPRSFISEILKVTEDRSIISFAGGLPNRDLFPVEELRQATEKVFRDGGMFLWVALPTGVSSMRLFENCIKKKIAFVPGNPFYVNRSDVNTLRLNFSCVDEETIFEGIKRLADSINEIVDSS